MDQTTTTFHSEDNEDEIITSEPEDFIMSRDECEALLNECRYSWISYENPTAKSLISRMMKFVYGDKFVK